MKILALSDLHLENRSETWSYQKGSADVVVLSGDIHTKARGVAWAQETFDCPVVYVLGNHEGWGGHWEKTVEKMKALAAGSHVHVLNNDVLVVDGVRFLGTTLWTDFSALGADKRMLAMHEAGAGRDLYSPGMRESRHSRTSGYRRILPRDTLAWNSQSRQWLLNQAQTPHDGPTVVVTHHPPVLPSDFDRANASLFDAAYHNDWQAGVDALQADVWIHGHTHAPYHRQMGKTLMMSHAVGHDSEKLLPLYKQLIDLCHSVTLCDSQDVFTAIHPVRKIKP